jgi:spore germination protein YaaH
VLRLFDMHRTTRAGVALTLSTLAACRGAGPLATPSPAPSSVARNLPALASVWGFSAPWDPRSDSSVHRAASKVDAAVTGWIQLDSVTALPTLLYPDDSTRNLQHADRYTLITSWHGDRFHPETIRKLGRDRGALAVASARIGAIVAAQGYSGVVLEFEAQSPADVDMVVGVARAIADSAKRHGAGTTSIALPATDTAAYPTRAFLSAVDFAVVMLYDEHWSTSAPGPIATTDWVRRALAQRVADVGASRIVAALPVYGYLWKPNQPAQPVGFVEAAQRALEANVELTRDPSTLSLHAIQPGGWELWMSDAQLLAALRAEIQALGVMRVALWRLGLEDPAIWGALSR